MSAMGTISARQWAQLLGLGLALAVTIVVVVALVLPAAALVVALAMILMAVAAVAQRAAAAGRAVRRATARATGPEEATQPTLRLELPGGEVVSARQVALPGASEHSLLLTRDGYVVVSAEGAILHRL